MRYEPRESINPRTFALRHALLEELKFRQRSGDSGATRTAYAALARAIEVSYEPVSREFVVRGDRGSEQRVPLDALRLYEPRADVDAAAWQRDDARLRANRDLAARLVDALLRAAPPAP